MTNPRLGQYQNRTIGQETIRAFVPPPLPPEPALVMQPHLVALLEQATLALGRLDGLAALLPDVQLFMYMYVRKEALLSSQIEGTQSSLNDLLLFESAAIAGVPLDDVQEVSRYPSPRHLRLVVVFFVFWGIHIVFHDFAQQHRGKTALGQLKRQPKPIFGWLESVVFEPHPRAAPCAFAAGKMLPV
jgi:Fic/DOC family N-terminal